MKRLLLGGGVLLALVWAGLLALGASQPEEHVASVQARFAVAPEAVWAIVTDFEGHADWLSTMTSVRRGEDVDGRPCWLYEGDFGPMPTVVDELTPTRLVTRIAPGADLGFEGTWTYTLTPEADGGCTLTLREDGRVTSLLFRGMGALFFDVHDSMAGWLSDLGARLGEAVEPQRVVLAD